MVSGLVFLVFLVFFDAFYVFFFPCFVICIDTLHFTFLSLLHHLYVFFYSSVYEKFKYQNYRYLGQWIEKIEKFPSANIVFHTPNVLSKITKMLLVLFGFVRYHYGNSDNCFQLFPSPSSDFNLTAPVLAIKKINRKKLFFFKQSNKHTTTQRISIR